jgi:hypothetical protein
MLVKEGTIIPEKFPCVKNCILNQISVRFHYLLATKADGKDGPLYVWDVPVDEERQTRCRVDPYKNMSDKGRLWPAPMHTEETVCERRLARVGNLLSLKLKSGLLQVVLKQWYERNKHIPPAYLWQAFVPNKKFVPDADKRGLNRFAPFDKYVTLFPVGHGEYETSEDYGGEPAPEQEQLLRDFYIDCKYCLMKYDFHA